MNTIVNNPPKYNTNSSEPNIMCILKKRESSNMKKDLKYFWILEKLILLKRKQISLISWPLLIWNIKSFKSWNEVCWVSISYSWLSHDPSQTCLGHWLRCFLPGCLPWDSVSQAASQLLPSGNNCCWRGGYVLKR